MNNQSNSFESAASDRNASVDLESTDVSTDIHWLAFQYISGELSGSEHAKFELRLAGDSALCEAVARQVMICESIVATSIAPTGNSQPSINQVAAAKSTFDPSNATVKVAGCETTGAAGFGKRSSNSWTAVACTAACMALTVWACLFSVADNPQMVADYDEPASERLVQYWVDVKQDVTAPVTLLSSQVDDLSDWEDDDPNSDEVVVPDWMLAAVTSEQMNDEFDMPEEVWE